MKSNFIFLNTLVLLCLTFAVKPGYAQALPECTLPGSDTDGDGYGWENNQSCIVLVQDEGGQCEDRGGYPWGWNPLSLESCRLDTDESISDNSVGDCVDTDPLNDGWGWDGVTSCRVQIAETDKYSYRCDDHGNYPWGWDPSTSTSCRLDLVAIPELQNQLANFFPTELLEIPPTELLEIPMFCRKFEEISFSEADFSSTNLLSEEGDFFGETGEIIFTATLMDLNRSETHQTIDYPLLTIDGSWTDGWRNESPLYLTSNNLLRSEPWVFREAGGFSSTLIFYRNAASDIFMFNRHEFLDGSAVDSLSLCVN